MRTFSYLDNFLWFACVIVLSPSHMQFSGGGVHGSGAGTTPLHNDGAIVITP